MVALLAVNTPGFPVPRASLIASAAGEEEVPFSLVSAGALASEFDCGCGCDGSKDCDEEIDEVDDETETEEVEEMNANTSEDCGCRKPKPPRRKTEFDAELFRMDLSVLDSRVGI